MEVEGSQYTHTVGCVLDRLPKVCCNKSPLFGFNLREIPCSWYLIGVCDIVSSGICIHLCLGKHVWPCGKAESFVSHVSVLTLSHSHRFTRETHFCPLLSTTALSVCVLLPCLRTSLCSCQLQSSYHQHVFKQCPPRSSPGKHKTGLTLALTDDASTTTTSS